VAAGSYGEIFYLLCPPVLPDMLAVLESVTAGRRGSRPLRGNFLHAVPSPTPDMLAVLESVTAGRRGSRPLHGNFLHACPPALPDMLAVLESVTAVRRGSRLRLTSLLRLAASG
jgi:hypothetical protein